MIKHFVRLLFSSFGIMVTGTNWQIHATSELTNFYHLPVDAFTLMKMEPELHVKLVHIDFVPKLKEEMEVIEVRRFPLHILNFGQFCKVIEEKFFSFKKTFPSIFWKGKLS